MYLIGESCMNPYANKECLECGMCGREFENGHITRSGKVCGTCKYYEEPMSECNKFEPDGEPDFITQHNQLYTNKNDTCDFWEDGKE